MRTLPQGAAASRRGVVHRGARPHDRAGSCSRAAGTAYLSAPSSRSHCVGVLLAGGAARRFGGRPKGLARLGGARIADLALAALRGASTTQVIVANDPGAPRWFPGERVIPDDGPHRGPLDGIATGLRAADGAPILVVAWDMPFVTGQLLRELRRRGETGARAVMPVHGTEGRAEPLCAWYAADSLVACRALLESGARRAGALFDALSGAVTIDDADLVAFGDPSRLFTSVDSPEVLATLDGTFESGQG